MMRLPRLKTIGKTIGNIGQLTSLLAATGALTGCGGGGLKHAGRRRRRFSAGAGRRPGADAADGLEQLERVPGQRQREADQSVADAFTANGLKDAGYTYVNIDDTWSNKAGRAADGSLQPDLNKFPDGISASPTTSTPPG